MVPLEDLKKVQFLQDLPEPHLGELAALAEFKELSPGSIVFRESQTSSAVFLVVEGTIALEICAPGRGCTRIHTAGPGELLGWSPLLGSGLMTATARVLAPSRVIAINASQVLAVCEHDPRFGMEIMRRTAQALALRLSATRLQLLDVYGHELGVGAVQGGRE